MDEIIEWGRETKEGCCERKDSFLMQKHCNSAMKRRRRRRDVNVSAWTNYHASDDIDKRQEIWVVYYLQGGLRRRRPSSISHRARIQYGKLGLSEIKHEQEGRIGSSDFSVVDGRGSGEREP